MSLQNGNFRHNSNTSVTTTEVTTMRGNTSLHSSGKSSRNPLRNHNQPAQRDTACS